jgi:Leucine-rich repeat (LRR) protein
MNNNELNLLNSNIGNLINLKYLNISNNELKLIPDNFSNLVNLRGF